MFNKATDQAWGAPLKEQVVEKKVIINAANGDTILGGSIKVQNLTIVPGVDASGIRDVIAKLKTVAATIEADIAYFNLQKGQGMAMNRLSFLKRDILDNVARLEKACPNH